MNAARSQHVIVHLTIAVMNELTLNDFPLDAKAQQASVTEIVYRWPDGKEEVRYRRLRNTPEALELMDEVHRLQKLHGDACPYSYRHI